MLLSLTECITTLSGSTFGWDCALVSSYIYRCNDMNFANRKPESKMKIKIEGEKIL
jgi:hypothetical protein